MKVCNDGKADSNADKAPKLNAIIRRYSREHSIRDFLIISDNSAADGSNDNTDNHPANTKIPIHKHIITQKKMKNHQIGLAFFEVMG